MTRSAQEDPQRFSSDGVAWHDVLVEAEVARLGLDYRIRLIESIDPKIVRNTELLADFAEGRHPLDPALRERAAAAVVARPGCSLADLITHLALRTDDAFALIAQHVIWCDLTAALLLDHGAVLLYRDAQVAQLVAGAPLPIARGVVECANGARVAWAGTQYEIANVSDTTVWLTSAGDAKKLSRDTFDAWVREGDITGVSDGRASLATLLQRATPRELAIAQGRFERIQPFIGASRRPMSRTDRRWLDAATQTSHLLGHALPGLMCRERIGNRTRRIAQDAERLADLVIDDFIMQPEQRATSIAYSLYRHKAKEQSIAAPMGRSAFYRRRSKRTAESVARAQWGKKAANAEKLPRSGVFSASGDRVFARVHIDHTLFDVALIDAAGTEELGRAWCTLARDAYTGRILAFVLLYDAPSARSLQLVLREMVRKWHRMPGTIIFDHGSDAASAYFETTCAVYGTNIERRPAGDPRYGGVVEGMFAKIDRDLIWNMRGNTKIRKNVRKMSPSADPAKNAVWTLGELHGELERYVAWHDDQPNVILGGTPKALHEQSLAQAGERESTLISYDVAFRALTAFVGPRLGGQAVVDRTGVTINGLTYWSEKFRDNGVIGRRVDVRYEPLNARLAYAKIGGTWYEASSAIPAFEGITADELAAASVELRRRLKDRDPSMPELAQHLAAMQIREAGLAVKKLDRAKGARRAAEQRELITAMQVVSPAPGMVATAPKVAPSGIDLEADIPDGFDKPTRAQMHELQGAER